MKAQIISIDGVIALTIFALFIGFTLQFVTGNQAAAASSSEFATVQKRAIQISDVLVTTPGRPVYWHVNDSQTKSIGLVWKDRVLSTAKLKALQFIDYEKMRSVLGSGVYDLRLQLLNASNTSDTCPVDNTVIDEGETADDANVKVRIDRVVHTQTSDRCKLRTTLSR